MLCQPISMAQRSIGLAPWHPTRRLRWRRSVPGGGFGACPAPRPGLSFGPGARLGRGLRPAAHRVPCQAHRAETAPNGREAVLPPPYRGHLPGARVRTHAPARQPVHGARRRSEGPAERLRTGLRQAAHPAPERNTPGALGRRADRLRAPPSQRPGALGRLVGLSRWLGGLHALPLPRAAGAAPPCRSPARPARGGASPAPLSVQATRPRCEHDLRFQARRPTSLSAHRARETPSPGRCPAAGPRRTVQWALPENTTSPTPPPGLPAVTRAPASALPGAPRRALRLH